MYYEINVSLNGSHFFATAERSILNEDRAVAVLKVLRDKFPEGEGYSVTATLYMNTGRNVTEALAGKIRGQARQPRRP